MYTQFFGNYLISNGYITQEQLFSAMRRQGTKHMKLGTLAIHAGYMMNIKSAVTGENTDSHIFQLTGIAAASLNIASWGNHDTKVAPGLMGAIQAGVRVSPTVELYLEPSATLLSKTITTLSRANSNSP